MAQSIYQRSTFRTKTTQVFAMAYTVMACMVTAHTLMQLWLFPPHQDDGGFALWSRAQILVWLARLPVVWLATNIRLPLVAGHNY